MFATQDQLDVALIIFAVAVAYIDWRTHRIPNLFCAAAASFGLLIQMCAHGEAGLYAALGGAAVGFGMFLPFYMLRAFGAGDVKAMATVGIFLGAKATLLAVGVTLIGGAALGAMVLLLKPTHANATLHRLIGLLFAPIATMRDSNPSSTSQARLRFPYGVAIACGAAVALLVLHD